MAKSQIVIDKIYWKRVQLFIKGHAENIDITKAQFALRNFTETKVLAANAVSIDQNHFICRFNTAIIDDGWYLPTDDYLLVVHQELDFIAKIKSQMIDPNYYDLDEEEQKNYQEEKTINGKNNYLLAKHTKIFRQGGNSKKKIYMVTPKISDEVNEFVLHVQFEGIEKKEPSLLFRQYKWVKKIYHRTSFKIRHFFFHTVFGLAKASHRKKGKQILFTSDSRMTMSGNFEFVYQEMLRQGLDKTYSIHQLFKPNIAERRNLLDKFRFPYWLGKADYIFVDDFHPLIYTVDFKDFQEVIQVWHAVGAFKTVGFSRTGKRGGPFFDSRNHRSYTKAYVSSETDVPFYAEAFGIKEENVIPTGVPRTDVLFDREYAQKVRQKLTSEWPFIKGEKVILFAPTFRGNGHSSAHYPFFKIDFERFAKYCEKENAIVLFKMHPFVKNKLTIPEQYQKYFYDVSATREVNDILFITDILISDYSSLIYEFAVFKNPMLFYSFDLEDYITSRDFYEPYQKFVPGKIVQNFDDLITALYEKDFELEKIPLFLDKHFKYQDGKSSQRLVNHLFSNKENNINLEARELYD